jgi:poly-gamma-glutamate synthesis protein (capsule biosynthesis protein)
MKRGVWLGLLLLLAIFAASPGVLLKIVYHSNEIFLGVTSSLWSPVEPESPTEEIRFTGDIMLARHVETLLRKKGSEYPYHRLDPGENTVWVGNFEASVPDAHTQTKDFTFSFSVDQAFLPALHNFGFSYLSLANNHSYDFGPTAYEETIKNMDLFTAFGRPYTVSNESITYVPIKDKTVGLLGISTVDYEPDEAELTNTLKNLEANSDFQIAYIHWGDEYELTHNEAQEQLAQFLIDHGADAVIGHHPHVVQDIAIYKNKPIFYSLGNFIFDQYFEESVQQGLVVKVQVVEDELQYALLPITSVASVAAPRAMTETEQATFFAALAERSDSTFADALQTGHITMRE